MASDDVPLAAERVFLYPGDPDATGIIAYETSRYQNQFEEIDFVDSSQFVDSLESDITLRDRSLLEVTDGSRFDVPDYQRNYSWEEDQHEEMWETIREVLQLRSQANEKPSDTFFGSIYVAKSPQRDRYEIIDGQQRLATIAIILGNLGKHLRDRQSEVDEQLAQYAEYIADKYIDELLYRQEGFNSVPFVALNDHDNPWFELLFKNPADRAEQIKEFSDCDGRRKRAYRLGHILKNKLDIDQEIWQDFSEEKLDEFRYYGEAHKKLVNADTFYHDQIENLLSRDTFSDPAHEVRLLINLTQYITRSLRVCECLFETDDQELRVEVFQSLNDRGIELSKMDKVRARIVGRFQGADDADEMIGMWEDVVEMFATDDDAVADFLAHYLAATEPEFKKVTDARDNMLEAFRLRDVQTKKVKSRLSSAGDARDFLEELEAFARRYRAITNATLREDAKNIDSQTRKNVQAILRRLNGLQTKSWRPFVMYVYKAVADAPDKNEFFHEVLQTVENIMFRFVISPHQATVIDTTFPVATQKFRELEQTGEQFDADRVTRILLDNIDESATDMFGKEFARKLIETSGWQNSRVKQLLMKIVDEDLQRRNQSGIMNSSLSHDTGEVHVEHVFPRSFILDDKENPYAWIEKFFVTNGENKLESRVQSLRDEGVGHEGGEQRSNEVEEILERIKNSFVRDLGNTILLDETVNASVKNALFGKKLKTYHDEHQDDMDNLANQYFTSEGAVESDQLDKLCKTDIPADETIDHGIGVVEQFDNWWTWERSIERKTEIIGEVLRSVTFSTKPDEFDSVEDNLYEIIKDDYSTRFRLVG